MSSCSKKRWGPGTTCERPTNTEAAKELQQRVANLQAMRKKQDEIWTVPEPMKNSGDEIYDEKNSTTGCTVTVTCKGACSNSITYTSS